MGASIKDNLISEIEKLPPDLQRRLLAYARNLNPKGVSGKSLLRFEGAIPPKDLELMSEAIEEACERVDAGEW